MWTPSATATAASATIFSPTSILPLTPSHSACRLLFASSSSSSSAQRSFPFPRTLSHITRARATRGMHTTGSTSTSSSGKQAHRQSFVGAIDQGTTSSRFIIFDQYAKIVASHQLEFPQIFPQTGQVEHRLQDLLSSVNTCIREACNQFVHQGHDLADIKTVGITNQRESTCCWSRSTGKPLYNCLVWPDRRNAGTLRRLEKLPGIDEVKQITGLRLSTYFAACKLRWMLDHVPEVQQAHHTRDLMVGTVDSWLVWSLTGGTRGGRFVTDVTNASRTMLMDLKTLQWSAKALDFFGVDRTCLADDIVSNSELIGHFASGPLEGVPITSMIGDQHAALVGQKCLSRGLSKSTYGTGCFLLYHTGDEPVLSRHGLLTTIGYKASPDSPPQFALEGSMAAGGSSVKWVRDRLGLINEVSQIGPLAAQVEDTEGLFFVTAFDGLLAPYWDDTATGTMIGITNRTTKAHIARATLEATCYQVKAVLDAMATDSGAPVTALRVDGGLTSSPQFLQIQADLSGLEVQRHAMKESTALGAALCAGSAVNLFGWDLERPETLAEVNKEGLMTFSPKLGASERERRARGWHKAVQRATDWNEVHQE